jgi:hypothetical protein
VKLAQFHCATGHPRKLNYLVRVRRRWIMTTNTTTNSTAAMILIVFVSIPIPPSLNVDQSSSANPSWK